MNKHNSKLYITLPQPCHEDWSQMKKNEHGRYCMRCRQTVHDFTHMADAELFNYFRSAKEIPCGRFNAMQLNRLVEPLPEKKCFPSYFKTIAAAVTALISVKAFAAKPTINYPVIQLVQQKEQGYNDHVVKDSSISGTVKDGSGKPIPNARISSVVFGNVYTDSLGRFSVDLSNGKAKPQSIIFSNDSMITVVRSYHPAMGNVVYDVVLEPPRRSYSCDIGGELSGTPVIFNIDLPSIAFKKNKSLLSSDAKAMLISAASKLKENPSIGLRIIAYPGKKDSVQKITDQRLKVMINYLVEKWGISNDRIVTDKQPGAGNENIVDLQVNL